MDVNNNEDKIIKTYFIFNQANKQIISELNGIETLIKTIKCHINDPIFCEIPCDILANIAENNCK